jgi:hypothetical protein
MFSEVHQKVYASQLATISFQSTKDVNSKEEDSKELVARSEERVSLF